MIRWIVALLVVQIATMVMSVSSMIRLNDRTEFIQSTNRRLEAHKHLMVEILHVVGDEHANLIEELTSKPATE